MAYIGGLDFESKQVKSWRKTLLSSSTKVFGKDDNGMSLTLPNSYSQYQVYVNGIHVVSQTDYVQTGNVLTFSSRLNTGDLIVIDFLIRTTELATNPISASGGKIQGTLISTSFIRDNPEQPEFNELISKTNAPYVGKNSIIRTNASLIDEDTEIPTGVNGLSTGTIEIGKDVTVTVMGEWTII
jgi:hypothetical protein